MRAEWFANEGCEDYGIWLLLPDGPLTAAIRADFSLIAACAIGKLGLPPIPIPEPLQYDPQWRLYCQAEEKIARLGGKTRDLSDAIPRGLGESDKDAVDPCTRAWLELLRRESPEFHCSATGLRTIEGKKYNCAHGSIRDVCAVSAVFCTQRARDEIGARSSRRLESALRTAADTDQANAGTPRIALAISRDKEGAMAGLPELPAKFQNAFVAAQANAELEYVNRAEYFPHHPEFAQSQFQPLIRIQAVFFAFCTEARNACKAGAWTAAQVSHSIDAAWPVIWDSYFLREHGTCSEVEKLRFRRSVWATIADDPRWKQHLSELLVLAEAAATNPPDTQALSRPHDERPVQKSTRVGRSSQYEIKKYANDRFDLVRDEILAEYEKKWRRVLRKVRLTGNSGGYLPALVGWGAERERKMVLALADAYVEAFTLHSVPSDKQVEKALQATAKQMAAGTISDIRGHFHLRSLRLRAAEEGQGLPWHLDIERAMQVAVKEGVLKLKRQRIASKNVKMDGGRLPKRSDFLERLSEAGPNYGETKRHLLEAWADSHGFVADSFSGQLSLSDFVDGCVKSFDQGALAHVAFEDGTPIKARCKELDVMAKKFIRRFTDAVTSDAKRLGRANVTAAIDEFSRRVMQSSARSKQLIFKGALDREPTIGQKPPSLKAVDQSIDGVGSPRDSAATAGVVNGDATRVHLGARLKKLKAESKLPWETIAKDTGISRRWLLNIQSGRTPSSDIREAIRVYFSRELKRPVRF